MISFIIELLAFIVFVISFLYLPGKLLLHYLRLKTSSPHDIFFSVGFGFMMFTLVAFTLSWFKVDILLLPLFIVIDIFAIKSRVWKLSAFRKEHLKPLIFVVILSMVFSITMLVAGKFGDGITYRTDDIWHLALINELKANFPPDNPTISGVPLKGYHFFYNFTLAKISNMFLISPLSLHFHLFPVFVALLWGLGVYSLLFVWSKKISVALLGVFMSMFGGSFAFLLALQGRNISLNSGLGISQPAFSLYNPPFAISIVIIIVALFALYNFLNTKQKNWIVPLVLCAGLVTMFKVYAGMILIGGFLILVFFSLLQKKFFVLLALFAVVVLFYFTYWIFGGNSGYLIWHPWWPPHTLLQSFDWYGYDEKIYTYTKLNVIKGIVETETYGFTLFILGNLGTRVIGLLALLYVFIRKPKFPSQFGLVVVAMAFAGLFTPLLFLQSGKVFEIIQMSWYYLFFCSLFSAFGFYYIFSLKYPKIIKIILFLVIIFVTLPSSFDIFRSNIITFGERRSMNTPYFQTLNRLSQQGSYNDTVLELPPQGVSMDHYSINGWYNFTPPEVTAFSNKRTFLANEYILFPGVELEPRLEVIKEMIRYINYDPSNQELIKNKLKEYNIHYILAPYEPQRLTDIRGVTKLFSNNSYTVYKVALK